MAKKKENVVIIPAGSIVKVDDEKQMLVVAVTLSGPNHDVSYDCAEKGVQKTERFAEWRVEQFSGPDKETIGFKND